MFAKQKIHMQKNKLIIQLQTLNRQELKRLEQYIQSPYFGKNEVGTVLFQLLKKHHPTFEHPDLQWEKLFIALFGKRTPYQEQKIRYAFSDLSKIIESFLAQEMYQKKITPYLLQAYAEKQLPKYFRQTYVADNLALDKQPYRSMDYFLNKLLLQEEQFIFNPSKDNYTKENIAEMLHGLDTYYLIAKLRYACEIYSNQRVLNIPYESPLLLDELLKLADNAAFKKVPVIQIYKQLLFFLTSPLFDIGYYDSFWEQLQTHSHLFLQDELKTIYIYICNICIQEVNKGNEIFYSKLLDFYRVSLDNGLIYTNGFLSASNYKNIVGVCLKTRDLEYAEQFTIAYKSHLPESERENAYRFNMARVEFHKKNIDQTMLFLRQVEFKDPYYHIDSNLLLMQCYYEKGDLMPLETALNTCKMFLRRNKEIAISNKNFYNNLLGDIRTLLRIRLENKTHLLAPFKQKLKEQLKTGSVNTHWMYDKLIELEKKKR